MLCLSSAAQDSTYIKKVKEEIQKLYADWNQARLSYDRKALEKLFTDDYKWVHGAGFVDQKATAIDDQLSTDSIRAAPIPDLSQLQVYGDVAVLKRTNLGPEGPAFNTSIYVRQNGRWLFSLGQTTLFQPVRKTVQLSVEKLGAYTGKYERGGRTLMVMIENDTLQLKIARIPKRKLLPVSDNKFFDKLGSEYTFVKDAQDRTTQLIFRLPNGPEVEWKKIE
jgi:hypothetical protein